MGCYVPTDIAQYAFLPSRITFNISSSHFPVALSGLLMNAIP